MDYSDSLEAAKQFTDAALAKIEKNGIPSDPIAFRLFYDHLAQGHPALNAALEYRSQNGTLPTEKFGSLYRKHIIDHQERAVEQARTGVGAVLRDLCAQLLDAQNYSERVTSHLTEGSYGLDQTVSQTELRRIQAGLKICAVRPLPVH